MLRYTLLLVLMIAAFSCKKLSLIKDKTPDPIDAGANLRSMSVWEFVSASQSSPLTRLSLYYKAVKLAGLEDVLSSEDITAVIPSDTAFKKHLSILGYNSVEAVPVSVLKNALLGNIKKGATISTDLSLNETRAYPALNGDSLYFTRLQGYADDYVLRINRNERLSAPSVAVRSQNLEFRNGAGHIVDDFPYYAISPPLPDAPTGSSPVDTVSFDVTKDVYIRPANPNQAFNEATQVLVKGGASTALQRFGLFQYPLQTPSFGNRIGAAKLYLFVAAFDAGYASMPLAVYTTENKNWDESSVTYLTAPKYSSTPVTTGAVSLSAVNAYAIFDVTEPVASALNTSEPFINFGVVTTIEASLTIRPREFLSPSGRKTKSYLFLSSSPPTVLHGLQTSVVQLDNGKSFQFITKQNLSLQGTADKNILYRISKLPANGFIVRSGIPMKANDVFTQSDLANGVVKYLYSGTGGNDNIELEAKDFEGGYFNDLIQLTISVN